MVQEGLLNKTDIEPLPPFPKGKVDYDTVIAYKKRLFHLAYERFKKKKNYDYQRFCSENGYWLEDFSLFVSLKTHFQGKVWSKWPPEIRDRQPEAFVIPEKGSFKTELNWKNSFNTSFINSGFHSKIIATRKTFISLEICLFMWIMTV
ncbi:4-alpha-glucanotransferase [Candidatus Methanoperedenaceae archaeon GB37]|nr:4-alpha-glucanotransferase [Candidatus Methanoperedenaceae archaeon GB37]